MTYHDLSTCTLDGDERRAEADRLVKIVEDDMERMSSTERGFVERMAEGGPVSVKQLFWLRDIRDKY